MSGRRRGRRGGGRPVPGRTGFRAPGDEPVTRFPVSRATAARSADAAAVTQQHVARDAGFRHQVVVPGELADDGCADDFVVTDIDASGDVGAVTAACRTLVHLPRPLPPSLL
ncbi:hypothetical protein AB0K57_31010 [Streptomyces halstedii]|uniref:hypothetical protein n=1 Tax=Streptomyces halstedii TaxID=1944 RepID=UPI000A90107A